MSGLAFELEYEVIQLRLDELASQLASILESECALTTQGRSALEYGAFQRGYEFLKYCTSGFERITPEIILLAVQETPIAILVLQAILGLGMEEWVATAGKRSGFQSSQETACLLDHRVRLMPLRSFRPDEMTTLGINQLVEVACLLLSEGAPKTIPAKIHRLDKADTKGGLPDVQAAANLGVPYPMLLYERFLGRPFAGHKDSVSELVGDSLEVRIEETLGNAGISYRKTKRAEKISGFGQAPDFIVPDEFNPKVVIEAKIAEDDGTARDKVTRVQHLGHLSVAGQRRGSQKYEVVACIGGRGFGIRREDMKKLLLATRGKVFTLKSLDKLIEYTRLRKFKTK